MKQRLLLVLLALFTSIGWMNADVTLTIPKGATGSLSFTATKEGKVLINGNEQTSTSYTIKKDDTNSQQIEITGALATLTVNTKVTSVVVSGADELTSLVFSTASEITTFSLDGSCDLKTLTANNCGLEKLPNNLSSSLDDGATVNLKDNKLTSVSSLDLSKKATYYFDGNQITEWPNSYIGAQATINYGSQGSVAPTGLSTVANEWFDIFSEIQSIYYPMLSATDASKLSYSWRKGTSGSFSTTLIKKSDTYAGNFQFYSGGEYQSGTYQCQVSPTTGVSAPTYVVTVDVKAAKFKLKIETEPTEGGTFEIANSNNKVTSESTDITKGEQLVFSATKKDGYTFSEYEVVGLSKVSDNVYKVDGHGEDKVLSAKAIFKKNTYKITVDASTEHGSYVITNTTDNSEVTNGKTVSHGDKLTIKATPEEGYKPRVIVNQEEKNYKSDDLQNGVYTFENIAITKNSTIQILFDKTEVYTLKVQYVTGYTLKVNGKSYESDVDKDDYYDGNDLTFPAGTLINLEMTGGTKKIKKILLNGAFVSSSSTAQFEMPTGSKADDNSTDSKSAFVTFETADLATITVIGNDVKPQKLSDSDDTNYYVQEYTYDGSAHAFQYTVKPTGLTGFTVKYSKYGLLDNYQATEPTAVGAYQVQITRSADANYAKYDSQKEKSEENFAIKIVKATPTITTAPTVTVTTDGDYSISGGVAQVGGKTVAGEWTVVDATSKKAITKCSETTSHLATVAFLPTDKSNLMGEKASDNTVSDAATVQVAVKIGDTALSTYKVTATNIPSDMSLTFWNGSNEVKSGSSVPTGTSLKIKLTYPAGYKKVYIQENKSGGQKSEEGVNGEIEWDYNTNNTTKNGLEAALDVTVTYEGSASVYTPVIEIQNKVSDIPYDYTGEVYTDRLYTATNFKFKTNSINPLDESDLEKNMTITYKDANGNAVVAPINAGEYTVVVSIPDLKTANGTYKAVTQEFKALYVIEKAEVKVSAWPSGAVVGVGKDAKTAQFIGGAADVEGTFHFIEEDKIGIPETGDEYLVKFVPKDSNNYKEVLTPETPDDNKVKIVVTDQRTLFISDVANGTITVTDQNNNELKDEQLLDSKITAIKVTAKPNSGYVLNTLTVNNTSIASGSTYTLGSDNVVVTATFIKQHTITLGSAPKGVKIATKPSSNVVVAGGSYTFTLNHVSGDKPTVTGASNISVSTSGSTTTVKVTNIQANATLAIALANPTAIKITTKPTLSKAGKPMGTIRVSGVNSSNECYYGDKITVTATANPGVEFSGWEDMTSTENPYEFEATKATYTFQAKYHGTLTGIESVDELNYYGGDGYIFVNCPAQGTLTIISMNGRAQKMSVSGQTRVTVPAGVYGIVLTSGSEVVRDKVVVR